MAQVELKHTVAQPIEIVYRVIADIERYPEFMPGFQAIEVKPTDSEDLDVWQTVGIGGLRRRFHTRARFAPPESIRIQSSDAPFRHLDQLWSCRRLGDGQTGIELRAHYILAEPVLGVVFDRAYPHLLRRGLSAIDARARIIRRMDQSGPPPAP